LIDRDEPRFAEASREMGERHDFIVPFFNGEYRFDKPPLTYWAQLTSFQVFGTNDFAARFPSSVAAALTAVALFYWGRRLGRGDRPGWYSAAIFTLAFQVVEHAKAAVADMWLVLFRIARPEIAEGSRRFETLSPSRMVVSLLRFAGHGLSRQRTDWLDAFADTRSDEFCHGNSATTLRIR
jgi:hypothetical protein